MCFDVRLITTCKSLWLKSLLVVKSCKRRRNSGTAHSDKILIPVEHHLYLSFHLINHSIVHLYAWAFSSVFFNKKGVSRSFVYAAQQTPLCHPHKQHYQANFDSHHNWNHLGELLIGVTLQWWTTLSSPVGSRYDTEQINVKTMCVQTTCTVNNNIGPIIYMGDLAINAALAIQLSDYSLLCIMQS